jgi:hypothetical protein
VRGRVGPLGQIRARHQTHQQIVEDEELSTAVQVLPGDTGLSRVGIVGE